MTINLTDSANHPANGPLTAERIERVRDELQRSIQYQNGGDMAYVIADAIKGLEELLVSKVAASEPVPDEELDQMIWKLERDGGMTPKMLSLMRELRERRKASSDPAYYVLSDDDGIEINTVDEFSCGRRDGQPLYTAPPAPVFRDLYQPVDPQVAEYEEIMDQAIPDNSFTNEELEAMAHGNNPVANAYRELLEFRRNSPVTPDGYVLVPIEPTHEMLEAGDAQLGTYDVYRRMIDAAPQEVK